MNKKNINIKYISLFSILTLNTFIFASEDIISLDKIDIVENKTDSANSYTIDSMNTATKLNLSIKDTPQTISVITTKEIKDKHISSYKDVLANIAGVSLNNRGTNIVSSSRGFTNVFYKIDGSPLYSDYSHNNFDMAIYDRVEVVKGANGLMTGEGNPSLSMNFIRKHADKKEFGGTITIDGGSWNSSAETIDLSTPLTDDKKVRARFIIKNADSKYFYDYFKKTNNILYGIVDAELSDNTSLSLGVNYQKLDRDGAWNWGLPAFYSDGSRTDFPRSTSITNDWAYWDLETKEIFGNFKHYLYNDISFNISGYYKRLYEEAHLLKLWWGSNLNKDGSGLNIQQYMGKQKDDELNIDSYINFPFTIGNLSQEVVAGISYNSHRRKRTSKSGNDAVPNIFDYDGSSLLSDVAYTTRPLEKTEQLGSYLVGRFSLTQKLNLITGLRISTWKYHSNDDTVEDRKFENEVTPYAGLVYYLDENHSLFASYTDIFRTQSAKDPNENYLDPILGQNYEAGIKGEYFDGKLNATFSVFKILEDNVAQRIDNITLPDGSYAYEAKDGIESKGFEISIAGQVTDDINTSFSIANFEAKDPEGVKVNTEQSRTTANIFMNYKFKKDFDIGVGLRYYSKYYDGSEDEYIEQKAYTVTNLMAKYKINKNTSLQLNINNLFDKKYYEGIGKYWMVYGEPRNFNLSLNYSF